MEVELSMTNQNKKIQLTLQEKEKFLQQFKSGVMHQLYREKLITNEQLNQVLKSINK